MTLSVENITPLSKFNTNLKIDTLKKEVNPEIQSMGMLGRLSELTSATRKLALFGL